MLIWQDVRYAVRTMLKSPGFTGVAILALALGIGANTAIFTVINTVLLRPLPYKNSERLVGLQRAYPGGRGDSISIPKFTTWKQNTGGVLANVAAFDFMGPGVSLAGQGQPEQVKAIHASADYFPLFGVTPASGRFYTADEDRPGGPSVAVISHGLWTRRFGADPNLVGHTVALSGEPFTIVGITAKGFESNPPADIWLPLQPDPSSVNQGHYLMVAGRLKDGVTVERANAAMKAAGEQFRRQFPDAMDKTESAAVQPLQEIWTGGIRSMLLVMFGAVGFVLLIACANVANLLLARAATREKEIAIRTAIGAGRWRLVRQLLTESVLLSMAGGVVGLFIGYVGVRVLLLFAPAELPRLSELAAGSSLDPRILGFTLLVSLLTGVLFGLAPAFQTSRPDLNSTLRESSGRSTSTIRHRRARGVLVISEMALGLVLLIGAGLLIRSALAMRAVNPGFDAHNVLTFKTALAGKRFETTAGAATFVRQVIEHLESTPGVTAASASVNLPTEPGPDLSFKVEGRAASAANAEGDENWRFVSPHFFRAMKIPLLRGRAFAQTDTEKSPAVVIVNEALARKYWPKQDPLGQRITIGGGMGPETEDRTREIVGIVGNARDRGLDNDPPPIMYVPQEQVPNGLTALANRVLPLSWVVRTAGDPLVMTNIVRREVTNVDSQQAVFDFRSMEQVVKVSLANRQFILLLLTVFAAIALLLAAIGIYGVMSYDVEQRTHEIGIRVALGADQGDVVRLVVRHGMTLAGIGVAIGLAAAWGVTRVLSAMLFGVKATDPLTFAAVSITLATVALAATYIPARRATRVDPMNVLRS